jgi:hypothetical protein
VIATTEPGVSRPFVVATRREVLIGVVIVAVPVVLMAVAIFLHFANAPIWGDGGLVEPAGRADSVSVQGGW